MTILLHQEKLIVIAPAVRKKADNLTAWIKIKQSRKIDHVKNFFIITCI